jgi:LCP family protein required for cell wall assembly
MARCLAAGVSVSILLTALMLRHLDGNLHAVSLAWLTDRPALSAANADGQRPLNILALGSQTRDGQNGDFGNTSKLGTDISDTAMLIHISADRRWAVVVSIPRDLIAPRPTCRARVGIGDQTSDSTVPGSPADMFDHAMNIGGPACAVATIEQLTNIRVDHFIELDFNAFRDMTNILGGITVCVPPPGINDPYSHLNITAGLHTVTGDQALAFVRDRHGIGDGSDLGRIRMQQMFVSSLLHKLDSNGTLTNPVQLYDLASAATRNLTVDPGLGSVLKLVDLAQSVQGLNTKNITFVTAPYTIDPNDNNRVLPGSGFQAVWTLLRDDTPLPGTSAAALENASPKPVATRPPSHSPAPGPDSAPTVAPSEIRVVVYNGTAEIGLAGRTVGALVAAGVHATVGGDQQGLYPTSEVLYPAGDQPAATALAALVPGAITRQSGVVSGLELILGQNAPATPPPTAGQTPPPPTELPTSIQSRAADENICSGLPTPVSYDPGPRDSGRDG